MFSLLAYSLMLFIVTVSSSTSQSPQIIFVAFLEPQKLFETCKFSYYEEINNY